MSTVAVKENILFDEAYFQSLLKDVKEAQFSIFLETYIYENDAAGILLANELCSASERGVAIRVLIDGIGSFNWGGIIPQKFKQANIKVRIYHPLPWFFGHWRYAAHSPSLFLNKILYLFSKINSRNHRKTCLIDNQIIYIGSANITEHLTTENQKDKWRETSVRILNAPIEEIEYIQEKAWGRLPLKKRLRHFFKKKRKESIFRLNSTYSQRSLAYFSLIEKLQSSQRRIWVTNAYFTPDVLLLKTLIKAGRRGIDVRILLPHNSDVMVSSLTARTFYANLLKNGIAIYEYLPTMLHAKSMIIDDWYLVGSSNLDFRSLKHDQEIDVIIQTNSAKEELEKKYLEDISSAKKITLTEINKMPFYKLLLGQLLLRIKYIL